MLQSRNGNDLTPNMNVPIYSKNAHASVKYTCYKKHMILIVSIFNLLVDGSMYFLEHVYLTEACVFFE